MRQQSGQSKQLLICDNTTMKMFYRIGSWDKSPRTGQSPAVVWKKHTYSTSNNGGYTTGRLVRDGAGPMFSRFAIVMTTHVLPNNV